MIRNMARNKKSHPKVAFSLENSRIYGGADGTRTRDPRRDRPVFNPVSMRVCGRLVFQSIPNTCSIFTFVANRIPKNSTLQAQQNCAGRLIEFGWAERLEYLSQKHAQRHCNARSGGGQAKTMSPAFGPFPSRTASGYMGSPCRMPRYTVSLCT